MVSQKLSFPQVKRLVQSSEAIPEASGLPGHCPCAATVHVNLVILPVPHPMLQLFFELFLCQLNTFSSLWGRRVGSPPRLIVWGLADSWFCILSALRLAAPAPRMSSHPDPGPALALDSLMWRELQVVWAMRLGLWDHCAPSCLPSPHPLSYPITSALSALSRTSGALSDLSFPLPLSPLGVLVVHPRVMVTVSFLGSLRPHLPSCKGRCLWHVTQSQEA